MNEEIFYALNSLAGVSSFFAGAVIFVAHDLIYICFATLFFAFFYFLYKKKFSLMFDVARASIAGIFSYLFAYLLKVSFPTPRPYLLYSDVNQLVQVVPPTEGAFPSGHFAFFAGVALTFLFLKNWKWGIAFSLLGILVALSRVISGVHFPIDMLGGLGLSLIVSIIFLPRKDKETII